MQENWNIPGTIVTTAYIKADLVNDKAISIRESFHNHTSRDCAVVMRSGLRFTVPGQISQTCADFVFRMEYTIPVACFQQLYAYFDRNDCSSPEDKELQIIRDKFLSHYQIAPNRTMFVIVDTIVEAALLKEHGSLYVNSRDTVVCLEAVSSEVRHPYHVRDQLVEKYQEVMGNRQGVNFFLELIDNEDEISDRYWFCSNRVFSVKPHKDPSRKSGVWFGVSQVVKNGNQAEPEIIRIDFADAEKELGLYRTKEEAASSGDVKLLRQEELARLTNEHGRLTLEVTRLTSENKIALENLRADYQRKEFAEKERLLKLQSDLADKEAEAKAASALADRIKSEAAAKALKHQEEIKAKEHLIATQAQNFETYKIDQQQKDRKAEDERKQREREYEDRKLKHQQELKEAEHKATLRETELANAKLEWNSKLEKTKTELEAERLKRDDQYDNRSTKRKETIEIVKTVALIATTALSIGLLIATKVGKNLSGLLSGAASLFF